MFEQWFGSGVHTHVCAKCVNSVLTLTLLPGRELLNAHLRRRRQSNLKYGQGLQGKPPNFYII